MKADASTTYRLDTETGSKNDSMCNLLIKVRRTPENIIVTCIVIIQISNYYPLQTRNIKHEF